MSNDAQAPRRSWALRGYAVLLALIGLTLLVLGGQLVTLGGSFYYALAGIAVIAAAFLLWRGDWRGGLVYAAMLAGTLFWALYEVGLDGWGLVSRLVAPTVLGLPLLGWLIARLCRKGRREAAVTLGLAAIVLVAGIGGVIASTERIEGGAQSTTGEIAAAPDSDWQHVSLNQAATRFSPLTQITPENASHLKLAWTTYIAQPGNGLTKVKFQGTPIKVGDTLYFCTGANDVLALDPDTGAIRWRFAARVNPAGISTGTCRGVAYYRVPDATGECAERIYTATIDARLLAIDARTGRACRSFGDKGAADLGRGMKYRYPGYYSVTSAPQLIRGKLVIGGLVTDNQSIGEPSGVIRAYDAITGKLAWVWDMGNPGVTNEPGEGKTYTPGTPNAWGPMSADETLGLVYVPLGNATPDYVASHRLPVTEKYNSSLVALDAETGIPRWNFQTTHRDMWDYDLGQHPTLIDLPTRAGVVPAVVQLTKTGELFVLDRRTGKPAFPVHERAVPQGAVAGEHLSPTQPFSSLPSVGADRLTEVDMWGATPIDQLWCRIKFRQARYEGPYTPIGLGPTISYPGSLGGVEWPAATFDAKHNLLVYPSNHFAYYNRLIPREQADAAKLQPTRDARYGVMFRESAQAGTRYASSIHPFLSPLGMPCQKPPFGRLNAVDLSTGRMAWSRPLGNARRLGPMGMSSMLPITIGTMTTGGAISTAGGVTFIGATLDGTARAFETVTGRLVWKDEVPRNILATPMTYATKRGRQYVVFAISDAPAVGGSPYGSGARAGGTLIAYSLR